jgi:hypothetical protein
VDEPRVRIDLTRWSSITSAFSHLRIRGALANNVRRFVDDSPVEQAGFELSVPRKACTRTGLLTLYHEQLIRRGFGPPDLTLAASKLPHAGIDAPSRAGPGNDINAGSPGSQKAPTRSPARPWRHSARIDPDRGSQVRNGLAAGGETIRTLDPPSTVSSLHAGARATRPMSNGLFVPRYQ